MKLVYESDWAAKSLVQWVPCVSAYLAHKQLLSMSLRSEEVTDMQDLVNRACCSDK